MKEIKAIVQPFLAYQVIAELHAIAGLPGPTVSEVRGFERGHSRAETPRTETNLGFSQMTKIEIVVPAALAEQVLSVIQRYAHTGNPGDGKIFVSSVEEVVRISTGERGEEAL